jgi:uncharacterized protein YhaN
MSPELSALARVLADLYRDQGTITRLVEQAGLQASRLPFGRGTPADWWFAVCELAESEDRMQDLVTLVQVERPRNQELSQAWSAYLASAETAPPKWTVSTSAWDYEDMEQQNARVDGRVDALQRDVADLRATVARLEMMLAQTLDQNKAILAQLDSHWRHNGTAPSSNQVGLVMLAIVLLGIVVFAAVYLGGVVGA